MQERHATVRIVMDQGQNTADSKTTWLSQNGADVRFLNGLTYMNSFGTSVGIMHSKIVAVDDQVVFTGSNNFSSTGFIVNEENSVVLRAPANATRIGSFICDIDTMFQIGVPAGQPQLSDDARKDGILALDQCNGTDVWFPPTGFMANGSSITYTNVSKAIYGAKRSVSIAPDMMAHPGLVSALIYRAKKAKAAGQPFTIKLVLDASEEALGNPAFGDCLEVAAKQYGLPDISVRYWRGTPDVFQLMHHKFMLIDENDPTGATLYNGSANYSAKALKYSFENVTRYQSSQFRPVVDAFTARFARMFADGQDKAALSASGVTAPTCPLDVSTL
jgi:phosphatidylserine/phosphatidylglycerophosphate/cardiolipin synthase-like enzyme